MKKLIIWVVVAVAIAIGVAVAINIMDENNEVEVNEPTTSDIMPEETEDEGDLLSRIVNTPEDYYGQEVTVAGEIQDVYNRRVFTLSDQMIGDELYVVLPQDLTMEQLDEAEELLEDNADVEATGTVQSMRIIDIEQEFGLEVPEEVEIEFGEARPVVIADRFTFSDQNLIFDFTQGPESNEEAPDS